MNFLKPFSSLARSYLNRLSEESVKLYFLVTFNIILSYIFSESFIAIYQVSQKILICTSLILTIFVNFLGYFTFTCHKKNNEVSIYKIISAVFGLGVILNMLLKSCIKLY